MDITRYHNSTPDWRRTSAAKQGKLLGLEIEVHHKRGRQEAADVLDTFDPKEWALPLAESDSSLDPHLGVEIICPPLPVEQVVESEGYIPRLMEALRSAGTTSEPNTNYGIHVNINLDGWEVEEKLAVQYFINKFSELGALIGNRRRGFGVYFPAFKFRRQPSGTVEIDTHNGDKHCAAWLRGTTNSRPGGYAAQVMEVRLLKSTLNIQHVRNLVDYVFALRDWVAVAPRHSLAIGFLCQVSANAASLAEQLFLHWCSKKRPDVYKLFANFANPEFVKERGTRLSLVQKATEEDTVTFVNIAGVSLYGLTSVDCKKQALRISGVIGKGLNIEGELGGENRIVPSTIRSAG